MDKNPKSNSSVQAVDRALLIIDFLKEDVSGLGITELAKRLDLAKSTVHRLLTSLRNKGYVKQDPVSMKYHLGLRFIELGSLVSQSLEIRKIAAPYMKQLVEETGETSHLVTLEDGEIIYIEKIESPYTMRMYSLIGKRAPVHCTGAGKAILAYVDEEKTAQIIKEKGLNKFTETTIVTWDHLMTELKETRERGYSIDNEEHEAGIRCVAAAIFNHHGEMVAGLSIAGPTMRMTPEKMDLCAEKVVFYAREISKGLGWRS
jgi:IclR family KDG regulon transcriptional repressor